MRTTIKLPPQSGIALPVMLIMLAVMLVSSIYLLRSSTSTTLTTANLAYDSALSKAVDLGVHEGFAWLSSVDKSTLVGNLPDQGYLATLNQAWTVNTPAFWDGAKTIVDPNGNRIQYVIHRMCDFPGLYSVANNCMLSAAKAVVKAPTQIGQSLASNAPVYQGQPELHYLVTARIDGARGGNVINQLVVMMGP